MRDRKNLKIKEKIIQKALATLFLTDSPKWLKGAFISVTMVVLSSDLSLAKVYVSISLNQDQLRLIKELDMHQEQIRKILSKKIAGKMYKIPNLKFIVDDSVAQGARVTALIDQIEKSDRSSSEQFT